MESEAVERRMKRIASHFAHNSTHHHLLLPMNCSGTFNTLTPRRDNTLYFARQDSASQPYFMKQGNSETSKSNNHKRSEEQPLFSRPINMNSDLPSTNIALNLPDHPAFATPNTKHSPQLAIDGMKWRPRMDVVDCVSKYVVTVELAGVSVNDIRVELHDQNLMIKGKRPTQSWRAYHRNEILKGSFNFVCPLPFDANKDTISADFQDGYLRVNIPKF